MNLLAVFYLLLGCGTPEPPPPPPPQPVVRPDVTALAKEAVLGVASVDQDLHGTEPEPGLYVLGERHDSILGQLQVALVAVRLQKKGVRYYSLEGAMASEALPPSVHRNDPDRFATALQHVEDGEISAAEFLHLVYDSEQLMVFGNEDPKEYDVELGDAATASQTQLLVAAALEKASPALERCAEFMKGGQPARGKEVELFECVLQSDSEGWKLYRTAKDANSLAGMLANVDQIERHARAAGVEIDGELQQGLESYRSWLRVAADRTSTMLSSTCARVQGEARWNGIIWNIGDAHSEEGVALARGTEMCGPFHTVLIHPLALKTPEEGTLSGEAYDRKMQRLSVEAARGRLGPLLQLTGAGRKPETVLASDWFNVKDEVYLATAKLARLASGGGVPPIKPPSGVVFGTASPQPGSERPPGGDRPDGLAFVALDPNTFRRVKLVEGSLQRAGTGIVFALDIIENPASATDMGGRVAPARVWMKAAQMDRTLTDRNASPDEEMLLQAIRRVEQSTREESTSKAPKAIRPFQLTADVVAVCGRSADEIQAVALTTG